MSKGWVRCSHGGCSAQKIRLGTTPQILASLAAKYGDSRCLYLNRLLRMNAFCLCMMPCTRPRLVLRRESRPQTVVQESLHSNLRPWCKMPHGAALTDSLPPLIAAIMGYSCVRPPQTASSGPLRTAVPKRRSIPGTNGVPSASDMRPSWRRSSTDSPKMQPNPCNPIIVAPWAFDQSQPISSSCVLAWQKWPFAWWAAAVGGDQCWVSY